MKKIVIVEDEVYMREELEYMISKAGYEAVGICDFTNTAKQILELSPDLVILDINLPGATGFEICRVLKEDASIPVLVLTSRDQMQDEIHALGLGADDFLRKPCHKERLLARVENLLRRFEIRKHLVGRDGFLLDSSTFTLFYGAHSAVLPENQGRILELLLRHPGTPVGKEALCEALWGTTEYIDETALQVNMTRVKKTLKNLNAGWQVVTLRGVGYLLQKEEHRGLQHCKE